MTASTILPAIEHKHAEINAIRMHDVGAGQCPVVGFVQKAPASV